MGEGSTASEAVSPFGESMVEELLHDSFLRHMLGSFFDMLQVRRMQAVLNTRAWIQLRLSIQRGSDTWLCTASACLTCTGQQVCLPRFDQSLA